MATTAPDPVVGPGEALVHPTRLLAGPADAAAIDPDAGPQPFTGVLGHQFVGIVRRINPAPEGSLAGLPARARADLLGKRVVGSPLIACTLCDMCRAGLPAHCRARRVMGLHARDGCFADLFAIPLANLVAVPDGLPDEQAVFAHAAAGAFQAARLLSVASRPFVTVIGDGAAALLTAQVLARQNPRTRLLYAREESARLCERWSIRHRAAEEPGRRQDQDAVVECTGTPAGLRLALQMVRPRGLVLLRSDAAGAPFPPGRPLVTSRRWAHEPIDPTPAIVNEVQIVGCREATVADGLGVLMDGGVDVSGLASRRFRLDDAPAAIAAAAGGDAVVIEP